MSHLVQDGESLLHAFQRGEMVAADRIDDFMRHIRTVAKGLGQAELQALFGIVKELESAVQRHRDELAAEIAKTGNSRRALRGYRHLRSHQTAQRLNTKG